MFKPQTDLIQTPLTINDPKSDLTIKLGAETIGVHRRILIYHSTNLAKWLSDPKNTQDELTIIDHNPDIIKAMIIFFYHSTYVIPCNEPYAPLPLRFHVEMVQIAAIYGCAALGARALQSFTELMSRGQLDQKDLVSAVELIDHMFKFEDASMKLRRVVVEAMYIRPDCNADVRRVLLTSFGKRNAAWNLVRIEFLEKRLEEAFQRQVMCVPQTNEVAKPAYSQAEQLAISGLTALSGWRS